MVAIEGEQLMVIANTRPLTSTAATAHAVWATGNPAPTFSLVAAPDGASADPVTGPVNVTRDGASFTWFPATDDKGVAGDNLYSQTPPTNCGRGVGCSGGPIVKAGVAGPEASHTIAGLSPGTAYAIWFEPVDAAGNLANTRMAQVQPLLRLDTLP